MNDSEPGLEIIYLLLLIDYVYACMFMFLGRFEIIVIRRSEILKRYSDDFVE